MHAPKTEQGGPQELQRRLFAFYTATLASDEDEQGLFGALSIPVALVGTSCSAPGAWNFDGALKEALCADVLSVAALGQGFYRAHGGIPRKPGDR